MTLCRTCPCGHFLSPSDVNAEGLVRCTRCGQLVPANDESPTPRSLDPAEETRFVNTSPKSSSLENGDILDGETRILGAVTDGAANSDDFEVAVPSGESSSGDATAVFDPHTKPKTTPNDDSNLHETNMVTLPASSVKSGSSPSTFSRRNADGSRTTKIDLKQPIMGSIGRQRHPIPASNLDNGQYGIHRILRTHQKGGMGRILIAYDQFLKRDVALKELHPEVVDDLSIVQRFIGEAEVTAQLEHPGIVPVHSLGLNEGNPYYTMKLIKGHTFQDAIKNYHRNPTKSELMGLVRRLASVCKTMSFAHNKGVIHRDLKPANIMLSEHGETLVMDWGLAKSLDHPEEETNLLTTMIPSATEHEPREARPELTMVGAVVGTLAFMSPEQATPEQGTVGPLSDIFSLGAVLYYLLTGQTAFNGRSTHDILNKVRNSTPIKPSLIKTYVPSDLEAICLKAMSRNPVGRYQSADEMFDDLCRWLDGEPVRARKESFSQKVWRWTKKHRRVSLSVPSILIMIVLLVVGGVVVDRIGREKTLSELEKTMLNQSVDLLNLPNVIIEGSGVVYRKEKKRSEKGPSSLQITVPKAGDSRLLLMSPTGKVWDLTSRQFLTLSILEHESGGESPISNFCIRLGKGSGYFEYRPADNWWEKRSRGNWTTFSIPLGGSVGWTKTVVNDPTMEQIQWIELHIETKKPTVFWIDNLQFIQRNNY